MSKFKKRIQKSFTTEIDVAVYGTGFGHLEDILDLFHSVFLFSDTQPVKRKNLIFRGLEDRSTSNITTVSIIFIDRNLIESINFMLPIMIKSHPIIIIEGNDPIERKYSKPLYDNGYLCKDTQGLYHLWKKVK